MDSNDTLTPWYEGKGSTLVTAVVGLFCKVGMQTLNSTVVLDAHKLESAIETRVDGRGLVTVSNHVSALDDPLAITSIIPARCFLDLKKIRWTLCADNRCFTSRPLSQFMSWGKVLPVVRGKGVFQPGMDAALKRLSSGDWVHVFPEGTRSSTCLLPMKPGVGRLISEPTITPLVVPFVHQNMDIVLPKGSKMIGVGKTVYVLVGDPIDCSDLVEGDDRKAVYKAIAARVGHRLLAMKVELENRVEKIERCNKA